MKLNDFLQKMPRWEVIVKSTFNTEGTSTKITVWSDKLHSEPDYGYVNTISNGTELNKSTEAWLDEVYEKERF